MWMVSPYAIGHEDRDGLSDQLAVTVTKQQLGTSVGEGNSPGAVGNDGGVRHRFEQPKVRGDEVGLGRTGVDLRTDSVRAI